MTRRACALPLFPCPANRAAAALAAGIPSAAHTAASSALAARPAWPKALFRRAEAAVALRRFQEAAADFAAALAAWPEEEDEAKAMLRCARRFRQRLGTPPCFTSSPAEGSVPNTFSSQSPGARARLDAAEAAADAADALRAAEVDLADGPATAAAGTGGGAGAPSGEAPPAAAPAAPDSGADVKALLRSADTRERDPRAAALLAQALDAASAGRWAEAAKAARAAFGADPGCHEVRVWPATPCDAPWRARPVPRGSERGRSGRAAPPPAGGLPCRAG